MLKVLTLFSVLLAFLGTSSYEIKGICTIQTSIFPQLLFKYTFSQKIDFILWFDFEEEKTSNKQKIQIGVYQIFDKIQKQNEKK